MHFYKFNDTVIPSITTLPYDELIPNTSDGAGEKHVPVISITNNTVTVKVGTISHPMLDAHYITFIAIETELNGLPSFQQRWLKPGMDPEAVFELSEGEEAKAVYEYCNLHGLWKSEANKA